MAAIVTLVSSTPGEPEDSYASTSLKIEGRWGSRKENIETESRRKPCPWSVRVRLPRFWITRNETLTGELNAKAAPNHKTEMGGMLQLACSQINANQRRYSKIMAGGDYIQLEQY